MTDQKIRNRLGGEKSPYLQQHAGNPVDWYPWGDEAFEAARRENRPIFLSIGYSTCHWCHVMAHESFEDPRVADLMNETFVAIKVDREERPDIDMQYMAVCQMMTGSGGWPLTIIMTPDKQPFFTGTYIPRETRSGNVGLLELIPRIKEVWSKRKEEALVSARSVTRALRETVRQTPAGELGTSTLALAFDRLNESFDEEYGGFGGAPKFPTPHNLLFLLRYWKRTKNERALYMVEKTLKAMRHGGMYDHVGFGFHRYATDRKWNVPHFEKMLYDQALLATAYTEAYQATGKDEYADTAREIFTYVLRDMTGPQGAFYAAEDADSEGEEGKFYLWTPDEIRQILPPDEAEFAARVLNLNPNGNFSHETSGEKAGTNIPYTDRSFDETAAGLNMPPAVFRERFESVRNKMYNRREKRVHPSKDDKILTDWNGLMIAALAKAAGVFDEPRYAAAAGRAAEFILSNMATKEMRLFHRYRDGESAVPANLDDYVFLIYGLTELYENTFEVAYLSKALELNQYVLEHFRDKDSGGFFFTPDDAGDLPVRQKEIYDGAIPSGNSIAMLNLLRLGRITSDYPLEEKASALGRSFSDAIGQNPSACTQFLVALDFTTGPSYEVVITGDPGNQDTKKMLQAVRHKFIPARVVIFVPADGDSSGIKRIAPFTANQSGIDGKATAYVCVNHNCRLPTTDIDVMLGQLE